MLRITTIESDDHLRIKLEGRLSGAWVAELDRVRAGNRSLLRNRRIVLDVQHLTGVDAAGRRLLAAMQEEGAAIENASPLAAVLLGRCAVAESSEVPR
ncbi:MAG: hypothetical protein HYS04_16140 [Acidobacteria bacterium]|nr:hypothetical protein [Acidobacteriota bacterium]